MGEVKFPSNSVISDAALDKDGDIIISVKGNDSEKNKEKARLTKENQEIREILFKNAKDDVGKRFLLYVYRELTMPEHGVSMTLDLKIPLETLENVDVESYVKDRVQGGYAYTCHVKDMSGSWPKNGNRECLRYYFEDDGVMWKEKNNRDKNKQEATEDRDRDRDRGNSRNETNILDVANVIKDAYSDASSKKEDEDKNNNQMFNLISSLVTSVSNKPKDNSTVELLTVMTPIITELIRPKNENNHTVEALRLISESMRDIGRSIADTNLKIAEKEREAAETRYKDKLEMLELVKNSGNNGNGNGGLADQAMKMLDMSNKMNSLVMTNMLGLFKNAIDMKEIMGNKSEGEEEVSVGKLILDKVLSPEMWKTGVDTFNALRGQKEVEGEEAEGAVGDIESEAEDVDNEEEEIIIERPVRINNVKKTIQDKPKAGNIMKKEIVNNGMDRKKTAELLNSVVENVVSNISQDVNFLVKQVLEKYKDHYDEMRAVLAMNMSEAATMLKGTLMAKAFRHSGKLQKVLDGLKAKLLNNVDA